MLLKPKVATNISMHPDALARLRSAADVEVLPSYRERIPDMLSSCQGIITYAPSFDKALLQEERNLEVISCHACPADFAAAAAARGIRVTCVPSLWDTVADMTLALIFATARMVPQADAAIRSGLWERNDLKRIFSGHDIFGKTLGIIGLGKIGRVLARRVQGFDMHLLYHDIVRNLELEQRYGLEYQSLHDLLARADIVTIQVPLGDETRGLIGEKELRMMKPDALLINTARGAIIDEHALYRALKERWIAAAGLDVFPEEPLTSNHPLLKLENVVLTPHLGGSTKECDLILVEDTLRVLRGEEPLHPLS
jgi:phosphoglycerate dehydrogenase-like enzyme